MYGWIYVCLGTYMHARMRTQAHSKYAKRTRTLQACRRARCICRRPLDTEHWVGECSGRFWCSRWFSMYWPCHACRRLCSGLAVKPWCSIRNMKFEDFIQITQLKLYDVQNYVPLFYKKSSLRIPVLGRHDAFMCVHDAFICVTRLIHTCNMTHSYVWHDAFVCMAWQICMCGMSLWHVCDMTYLCGCHDSFMRSMYHHSVKRNHRGRVTAVTALICTTLFIYTCDMTHSYVWHDSFICVTCLIHTCDMTQSYVWHDAFIHVTWLIHTCDMTHSFVWHASFIHVTRLIHTCDINASLVSLSLFVRVTWRIHTCDTTHLYVWHDSFTCDMTHPCMWHECLIHTWLSHSYVWKDACFFFCLFCFLFWFVCWFVCLEVLQ